MARHGDATHDSAIYDGGRERGPSLSLSTNRHEFYNGAAAIQAAQTRIICAFVSYETRLLGQVLRAVYQRDTLLGDVH